MFIIAIRHFKILAEIIKATKSQRHKDIKINKLDHLLRLNEIIRFDKFNIHNNSILRVSVPWWLIF